MRAQCRQLATVVAISGSVDAANIGEVIAYTKRFILADKPIILDLTGVESFAPQCDSLFDVVEEECRHAEVEWVLVANSVITDLTRIGTDPAVVPTVDSVADALHYFADEILARRRRILPLLAKTA
jgi:anti-anti-sigma regulatory factor